MKTKLQSASYYQPAIQVTVVIISDIKTNAYITTTPLH